MAAFQISDFYGDFSFCVEHDSLFAAAAVFRLGQFLWQYLYRRYRGCYFRRNNDLTDQRQCSGIYGILACGCKYFDSCRDRSVCIILSEKFWRTCFLWVGTLYLDRAAYPISKTESLAKDFTLSPSAAADFCLIRFILAALCILYG